MRAGWATSQTLGDRCAARSNLNSHRILSWFLWISLVQQKHKSINRQTQWGSRCVDSAKTKRKIRVGALNWRRMCLMRSLAVNNFLVVFRFRDSWSLVLQAFRCIFLNSVIVWLCVAAKQMHNIRWPNIADFHWKKLTRFGHSSLILSSILPRMFSLFRVIHWVWSILIVELQFLLNIVY